MVVRQAEEGMPELQQTCPHQNGAIRLNDSAFRIGSMLTVNPFPSTMHRTAFLEEPLP
jgi:hypothetical protein